MNVEGVTAVKSSLDNLVIMSRSLSVTNLQQ